TRLLPALLTVLTALTASAQQAQLQPPQQNQQPFTLKVSTQLVIETVVVKDKDGKPIEGLTAKDFAVTEDGVPQTISVFEFQKLDDAPAPATTPAPAPAPVATPAATPARADARYRDHRLLDLFFDMLTTPPPDQLRAFTA